MTERQEFGRANEKRAVDFLRKQKHRIIKRNYLTRHGEIDVISVINKDTLVFTEVRSKHNCLYGHPVETINQSKQQHIRYAAQQFLYENKKYQTYNCRFDVITIVGEGREMKLEYFPDAF